MAKIIYMPKMTGIHYAKKVEAYLDSHLDDPLIQRLRTHQLLTPTDLAALEKTVVNIGEEEGETLLATLLEQSRAPSLVHYILRRVGMDRTAAHHAFAQFLDDPNLTPTQTRFIEMAIDQLAARGFLEASALYESPFTNLHGSGPDVLFAGKEKVVEGLFRTLESLSPASDITAE